MLEGTQKTHLHMGKGQGYPRSYVTESLALARDSKNLCKNTEVNDESLHLYRPFTFGVFPLT